MQVCEIRVEGVSPLLMNNPAGMANRADDGLTTKKKYDAATDAEAAVYRLPSGQLYLPSMAFRACLLSGAKNRKIGKMFATTVVAGSVFTIDIETALYDGKRKPIKSFEIDTRRAVVGKAGISRSRPRVAPWAATVRFEFDPDFIDPKVIAEILGIGGRLIGVGDFRPERKGPFGRFSVAEVK